MGYGQERLRAECLRSHTRNYGRCKKFSPGDIEKVMLSTLDRLYGVHIFFFLTHFVQASSICIRIQEVVPEI